MYQKEKLFAKKRLMKHYHNHNRPSSASTCVSSSLIGLQTSPKNMILSTTLNQDEQEQEKQDQARERERDDTGSNVSEMSTIDRLNAEYETKYKSENMKCINPDQFSPYIIVRWENHYLKVPYKKSP